MGDALTIRDTAGGGTPTAPAHRVPGRGNITGTRVLVTLLVMVLAAGALWHHHLVLRDHRAAEAEAGRIVLVTQRIAFLAQTATSAERSFALTGDVALLDPFFPALEALSATAQRLEVLVEADHEQARQAATVSDLVVVRIRQMWTSIDSRRIGGPTAARRAVGNPQVRETDRRLTEALDAIASVERAASRDRQTGVAWLERALVATAIGMGLLLFRLFDGQLLLSRRAGAADAARGATAKGSPVPT